MLEFNFYILSRSCVLLNTVGCRYVVGRSTYYTMVLVMVPPCTASKYVHIFRSLVLPL